MAIKQSLATATLNSTNHIFQASENSAVTSIHLCNISSSDATVNIYLLPTDGKVHRYFPDFYIKVKRADNKIRKMIIEVKPEKYTKPPKKPKKETKSFIKDVYEWGRNQAKWKHAREYCRDRNMDFLILTEKHLMPQYK